MRLFMTLHRSKPHYTLELIVLNCNVSDTVDKQIYIQGTIAFGLHGNHLVYLSIKQLTQLIVELNRSSCVFYEMYHCLRSTVLPLSG